MKNDALYFDAEASSDQLWFSGLYDGAKLYYIASHASGKLRNPEFEYTFENATVTFSQSEGSEIKALFNDGTEKSYGDPFKNGFQKIHACVDAIKNGSIAKSRHESFLEIYSILKDKKEWDK